MGLFKKDEEVPELPKLPSLPELPNKELSEKKELPELPSFPATQNNENINQEMVKSAVTDAPSKLSMEAPSGEEEVKTPEGLQIKEDPSLSPLPSPAPGLPSIQSIQSTKEPAKMQSPMSLPEPPRPQEKKSLELHASISDKSINTPATKQSEPIFVRIDKFQAAQKNFEQIRDKVKEIESVLKKIKDVKSQEETEIKGWTEDVEKIKARLSEIDTGIFDQI